MANWEDRMYIYTNVYCIYIQTKSTTINNTSLSVEVGLALVHACMIFTSLYNIIIHMHSSLSKTNLHKKKRIYIASEIIIKLGCQN